MVASLQLPSGVTESRETEERAMEAQVCLGNPFHAGKKSSLVPIKYSKRVSRQAQPTSM